MRKIFFNNTVLELCTSIQEGLPIVPTSYFQLIIEGIFAAAAKKYPVTICAYVVMRNHLHMIVVVQNPQSVSHFMRYVKTEMAHAINHLLGRKSRSVWIGDFDNPVILDAQKVMERLEYLYLNPAQANQCKTIRDYPGVSSFEYAEARPVTFPFCKAVRKVSRDAIPKLPTKILSIQEQDKFTKTLRDANGEDHLLFVNPWAWLSCFPETTNADPTFYQKLFLDSLFKAEATVVKAHKYPAPSAKQLRMRDPREKYESARDGKKMICLSTEADLRCPFIKWYKAQAELAKKAIRKWCRGNVLSFPPPGFYLPGGMLFASALFPDHQELNAAASRRGR